VLGYGRCEDSDHDTFKHLHTIPAHVLDPKKIFLLMYVFG